MHKRILINLLILILFGCGLPKSPEVNLPSPEFKLDPKTEELLRMLSTCNKKDDELGLLDLDKDQKIIIQDSIENKDIIEVDCDKKQTPKGHGPIRELEQFITVEPPVKFKEKVNFVSIENIRTCSGQNINAQDDMVLDQTNIEVDGQPTIALPKLLSSALGFSGKLKILLSDSTLKLPSLFLNVRDNNNVVDIKYFGKCLKYREKINDKLGDAYNCAEAEFLGNKKFFLSVQVERKEASGSYLRNTCTK